MAQEEVVKRWSETCRTHLLIPVSLGAWRDHGRITSSPGPTLPACRTDSTVLLGCWEDGVLMMGAAGSCVCVCDQGITRVGAFLLLRNHVASFAVCQI